MLLRDDIDEFLKTIPVNVVAATKYVDSASMRELYKHGVNNFGENRVEPFLEKYDELKDLDIRWHFIGHLQRNKCKLIINKIDCLHSLDSLELAKMIDKERTSPLDVFIEVSINLEENKNGVDFHKIDEFMEEVLKYKNINVVGFMMMAIKADTHEDLLKQFKALAYLKERTEKKFNISMPYLSMGMSNDYNEAIEAGATHVRLGRILWQM
ncbi:MAG: YggS family pyridoxal phosphate-dependent enzyme [Acholeplasmatales bacterium]|nr:YggS family pyridoxal phosphate-dependent enzyme [Acholeplasmatales bacterium]